MFILLLIFLSNLKFQKFKILKNSLKKICKISLKLFYKLELFHWGFMLRFVNPFAAGLKHKDISSHSFSVPISFGCTLITSLPVATLYTEHRETIWNASCFSIKMEIQSVPRKKKKDYWSFGTGCLSLVHYQLCFQRLPCITSIYFYRTSQHS